MADTFFSFNSFNPSDIQTGYEKKEFATTKESNESGEIESFCLKYGLFDENMVDEQVCEFNFSAALSVKPQQDAKIPVLAENEAKDEKKSSFGVTSLELLRNYVSHLKKPAGNIINDADITSKTRKTCQKLSTEEILRVAGERYIHCKSQMLGNGNNDIFIMHPYGSSFSGLPLEEKQDVELAEILLAAAEKVGDFQFDQASRLLTHCELMASNKGSPVQRVVYYFAKALKERMDRAKGSFVPRNILGTMGRIEQINKLGMRTVEKTNMASLSPSLNLANIAWRQEIPFTQTAQFAGVQAILENVKMETKVHVIDLQIRSGAQWAVLMQALADQLPPYGPTPCLIKHLKITAVETEDKQKLEETGRSLTTFAESLKLPFSFNVVFKSDMEGLNREMFDIEYDEAVVIYAPLVLRYMVSRPNCLDNVMRVVRRLRPCLMVVNEVEANHNSPSFVNRFIEAFFWFGAFFDSMEDTMHRDNQNRSLLEEMSFGNAIKNIVSAEGRERISRSVKIEVWRQFIARFGMVEIGLSEAALNQANLMVQQFACGSSCTLKTNGKTLSVGRKGTPFFSLSTWKFS